jgi:hypothetical protein
LSSTEPSHPFSCAEHRVLGRDSCLYIFMSLQN